MEKMFRLFEKCILKLDGYIDEFIWDRRSGSELRIDITIMNMTKKEFIRLDLRACGACSTRVLGVCWLQGQKGILFERVRRRASSRT